MMKIKQLVALCILFLCTWAQAYPQEENEFIFGADLSMVKAILDNGGEYTVDNEPVDVLLAFKDRKFSYARLRLFHSPIIDEGSGIVNSLDYTVELAQQIKASGLKLLLDFHYSDSWADPSQQTKPAAWIGLDFETLNDSLYQYTKAVMNRFAEAGISPDMVQTGNEINHGMLWDDGATWANNQSNWPKFTTLLKSAISGVRESENGSDIPVMVHGFGVEPGFTSYYMDSLAHYGVDFDIIGISYYMCWGGEFSNLLNTLNFMNTNYDKEIVIVETNYQSDGYLPDYCVLDEPEMPFPLTEQGQFDYLQELFSICSEYEDVCGLFYWGGELIWAGDIGGSWSSLFHWQGDALMALDAFNDLNAVEVPTENKIPQVVYEQSSGIIQVVSEPGKSENLSLCIFDLMGRRVFDQDLEYGNEFVKLPGTLSGIHLVILKAGGKALSTRKIYFGLGSW